MSSGSCGFYRLTSSEDFQMEMPGSRHMSLKVRQEVEIISINLGRNG